MKKLIIFLLTILTAYIQGSDLSNNLQEISATLTNLSIKAKELNILEIPKISPIAPVNKQSSQEIQPLSEVPLININIYFRLLRNAIASSLVMRELDVIQFGRLSESPELRAAKYVLERLFALKIDKHPYTIIVNNKTKTQTFSLENPQYKIENVPLDLIVDQILLISRLIDYIITNYEMDKDISIVSIDTFKSIFNIYFALALNHERTTALSQRPPGKLDLKIVSDSINKDEFERIQKTFEKMNYSLEYFTKIPELLKNDLAIDIYLVNEQYIFDKEKDNVKIAENAGKKIIFSKLWSDALAIGTNNIAQQEKDSLFNLFTNTAFKTKKTIEEKAIENYRSKDAKIPLIFEAVLIDNTQSLKKEITPLFILNSKDSYLAEFYLPNLLWPEITWEIWKILYQDKLMPIIPDTFWAKPYQPQDYEFFKYDKESQEFVKLDNSISSQIKYRKITWKPSKI